MDTAEGEGGDRKGQTEIKRGGCERVAEKWREGKESDASAVNAGEVIQHVQEIFSSSFSRISSSFSSFLKLKKKNSLAWHMRYKRREQTSGYREYSSPCLISFGAAASADATFLISCSSLDK